MDRYRWTPPPASAAPETRPPLEADATPRAQWFAKFILSMAFFGTIGALCGSSFPISLGLFLFFTDETFVVWAFQAVGIRLEPGTLGSEFIKSLVFLVGVAALIAFWKDAAPTWLSSQLPAGSPPWVFIAGIALLISVLSVASAWLVKFLLPEIARGSLTWTVTRAGIALAMFGLVTLFAYGLRPL